MSTSSVVNCSPTCSCLVEESQPETKVAPAPTPAPAKKEAPVVAETKAQDGAPPPTTTTGKKKNSAKKQKTEHGEKCVCVCAAVGW